MIVMGFRIPRGCFRGIEEGTYFGAYATIGYSIINRVYAPMVLRELCYFLEDEGYEAVPVPDMTRGTTSVDMNYGTLREGFSRPVSPDRPAPDVLIHFRIAAFCAGLGEIGYSKLFLTPEFGPRQKFAVMLTDAPLESDPIFEGEICDRCMLCVKECPAQAINKAETVKVEVASREIEWGKFDVEKCSLSYMGRMETNPHSHPPEVAGGARGCMRACMIHLEETGRIKNSFKNRFRKRKPWDSDYFKLF